MRIRREPTEQEQREGLGCLLLVVATIAFVVSSWFTYREAVYALVSRRAAADVVSSEIVREFRGKRTVVLRRVRFEFRDAANGPRTGTSDVDRDSPIRAGDRVPIEYTDQKAYPPRLVGTRRWGMILLCVVLFGLTVVQGTRLWIEARAAVREAAGHAERRRRVQRSDRPVPRRDPEPFS